MYSKHVPKYFLGLFPCNNDIDHPYALTVIVIKDFYHQILVGVSIYYDLVKGYNQVFYSFLALDILFESKYKYIMTYIRMNRILESFSEFLGSRLHLNSHNIMFICNYLYLTSPPLITDVLEIVLLFVFKKSLSSVQFCSSSLRCKLNSCIQSHKEGQLTNKH